MEFQMTGPMQVACPA